MKFYQKNSKTIASDISHDEEHEQWSRRTFLQALGLAGGGTMMLGSSVVSASQPTALASAIAQAPSDRILVMIRLRGGNDGLNTIVPIYDYDRYAQLRPTLRHRLNTIHKLNNDFGIPSSLSGLRSLWGEGAMKVIHGVGYKEQDLSHFKSSNIWASADVNDRTKSGFMGRHFEKIHPDFIQNPPAIPAAIQIGSVGNMIFDGNGIEDYAVTVANPQELEKIGNDGTLHRMTGIPRNQYGNKISFLRSMANNTFTYAKVISKAYSKGTNARTYQNKGRSPIGQQLAHVARLIKGRLGTKVYMVTLDGFDTHANQAGTHQNLLTSLSEAIQAFFADLKTVGMDKNVLAMTISEFGRRATENGSRGTDHGAAAPMLLFSPALDAQGFIGKHSDLNKLDTNGNLEYGIDFREVYASVLKEWLCLNHGDVNRLLLNPSGLRNRNIGVLCRGAKNATGAKLSGEKINIATGDLEHSVHRKDGRTFLTVKKSKTSKMNIIVYSLTGQKIGTVLNDIVYEGTHTFNLTETLNANMSEGMYVYRIFDGGQSYSKQFMV